SALISPIAPGHNTATSTGISLMNSFMVRFLPFAQKISSLFGTKSDITSAAMKQKKLFLGAWAGLVIVLPIAAAERLETLPQTKPLDWEETDLSARLMDDAHRFIERKISESVAKRGQFWARDFSSPGAYAKSVQPNRSHFQTIVGAVDSRLPARLERFGDDAN